MMKTIMTCGMAMTGAAVMVAALLAATAPQAEDMNAPRSGVGNDRTGNTVSNAGMVGNDCMTAPNSDIAPMSGFGGTPVANNTYIDPSEASFNIQPAAGPVGRYDNANYPE